MGRLSFKYRHNEDGVAKVKRKLLRLYASQPHI